MSRLSIFSVLPLLQLVIAQNASTILPNTYVTTTLGSFEISNSTACACNHLLSTHPSLVLTPDSANYTVQATDYWDIKADLSPACIFLPIDADQVADAVSIFNTCNAQFAIRGGGHMNVSYRCFGLVPLTDGNNEVSRIQQHRRRRPPSPQ